MRGLEQTFAKLEHSPMLKRLTDGIFWSLAGSLAARLLTLYASVLVSRQLGKEGFGELGIIQSTIMMLGELAGAGVGLATTKFIAEYRESDAPKASRILSLNLVVATAMAILLSIALAVFSEPAAIYLLKRAELSGLLQWGAVLLLFSTTSGVLTGALSGFEAFRQAALVNVIYGVVCLTLQASLLPLFGINGVVAALAITALISSTISLSALRKCMKKYGMTFSLHGARGEIQQIYAFNLPALMASLMVVPINWIANMLLIRTPDGFGEMGLFNAANQWRMALLFIPTTVGSVVLPILSNMVGKKDGERYKKVLIYNLAVNATISAIMIFCVYLFSDLIMSQYGTEFSNSGVILHTLIVVAGLMAVNSIIGSAISSIGKLWAGFFLNIAWAASLLISASILVPRLGALGLAYANLIAYALHTVWQYAFLHWKLNVRNPNFG